MPTENQPPEDSREVPTEPIVRETVCKSIFNRSGLSDYSLNCYTGCTHACVYCYARFMQRFHPHDEPWGAFVDVKVNAIEVLKRQLRRAEPGTVFVSSACDGWQPVEAERRLTRRCCELLLEHGFQVHALTKSALVLRDLDVFAGRSASIGITLTTLDERLRELWEPGTASVRERLAVIEAARDAGLQTSVMFGPLLPFLSDSQPAIDALLEQAADLGVDRIWVDAPQSPAESLARRRRSNPREVPRATPAISQGPLRPASAGRVPERSAEAYRRRGPAKITDGSRCRVYVTVVAGCPTSNFQKDSWWPGIIWPFSASCR